MLSELNEDRKGHLAWRLDHNTACGFLTAASVARGEHGDMDIVEIFMKYGNRSSRSAKALARKVEQYVRDEGEKRVCEKTIQFHFDILSQCRGMDTFEAVSIMERLAEGLRNSARLFRIGLPAEQQRKKPI